MQLELGKIYDGKVTNIKEYGAFVEILEENVTGMVHISQISDEFVSNAKDYLTEGQTVKVKFIGTNEEGKIKLSIKEALTPELKKNTQRPKRSFNSNYGRKGNSSNNKKRGNNSYSNDFSTNSDELFAKKSSGENFEDMLSKFKQRSDENLNDLKKITDRRNHSRRK